MKKQDFHMVLLQHPDAMVENKKPLQFSAPLCEGWHPASLCETPAAELAGDTALEERDTRKPKIKKGPLGLETEGEVESV